MTSLEAIKEDFNIGDPIRIACGLGIKEIRWQEMARVR